MNSLVILVFAASRPFSSWADYHLPAGQMKNTAHKNEQMLLDTYGPTSQAGVFDVECKARGFSHRAVP